MSSLEEEKPELYRKYSCRERGTALYEAPEETNHASPQRWYQRDINQITYSTAFRKLQRKSQLLPELDPRRRTRLIHTLEVARIAKDIAFRLNVDAALSEGIALAHDIANSPYGAVGNKRLAILTSDSEPEPFCHEKAGTLMLQSIAAKKITEEGALGEAQQLLEDSPQGFARRQWPGCPFKLQIGKSDSGYFEYRVTPELLDGVTYHNKPSASTLEGQVVAFADNIAYISQDIDDLIEVGLIEKPKFFQKQYGKGLETSGQKMTWQEINQYHPGIDLKRIFGSSSDVRIRLLSDRFVSENLRLLEQGHISLKHSEILDCEIPIFSMDEGLKLVIDYIWREIIQPCYEKPLIKTAAELQSCKIEQLFIILRKTPFAQKNSSY